MNIRQEIIEEFKNMVINDHHNLITVKDICKHLNISRKTFYKYFQNREDIVRYIVHEELFVPLTYLSQLNNLQKEDSILVLDSMYSKIYNDRDFYKKLDHLKGENHIFLDCIFKENLILNQKLSAFQQDNLIDRDFQIYLAAKSGSNLIEKWIKDDFNLPSRKIAELFYKYIAVSWVSTFESQKFK